MVKITLNVVEPGSSPVVPNTGLATHGVDGTNATIIAVSAILILALIIAVTLFFRKKYKSSKAKTSTQNRKRITAGLMALGMLVSACTFSGLTLNSGKANTNATNNGTEEVLTVEASDAEYTIELADEPTFVVVPVDITVKEATAAGYTLRAYTVSPDLTAEGIDQKVAMVTTAEGAATSLADNTWGLSLSEPSSPSAEVYQALPLAADDASVIKTADNYAPTAANDTTTVYYGFYITPDMPVGTYVGAVVDYSASINSTTVTFDGNGLYFNDDESRTTNTVKYINVENEGSRINEIISGEYLVPGQATPYVFSGWSADPEGTTPIYDSAESIAESLPISPNQPITLYAQWHIPTLYDKVQALVKRNDTGKERTQTLSDMQADITAPTTTDHSTDTSNSGVYRYDEDTFGVASDASDDYAIYYYRGVLEPSSDQGMYGSDGQATTYPNYVRLGNDTCWRIVRTTGSGGTKMIYNGIWTGTTCANNRTNAQFATSRFNEGEVTSIVYTGYTYNSNYTDRPTTDGVNADIVLGSNANPAQNDTRSTMKTYIEDTWYATTMLNYTNKLEPSAGYCADRSLYDSHYNPISAVDISQHNILGAYKRNENNNTTASLSCPRGDVDNYQYKESSVGIGNELKYPAALLTADEAAFAGSGYYSAYSSSNNIKSFLCSGYGFSLLSPGDTSGTAASFTLNKMGPLSSMSVNNSSGVRPAISLKHETTVLSGSGTATDPWIINE